MAESEESKMPDTSEATTSSGARLKMGRKRVHWRTLVLPDSGVKIPGHIVEVSHGYMHLISRYSFAVGSRLNLAVFVPDALNEGSCVVTQLAGEVTCQVMRGDEVQTGLSVNVEGLPRASFETISAAIKANP
ncbi:MAG: hypothetical protein H6R19_3268 [Proteobacteria bacterium]|nr:hypothetical protein [Pseudomonadota bacterium]